MFTACLRKTGLAQDLRVIPAGRLGPPDSARQANEVQQTRPRTCGGPFGASLVPKREVMRADLLVYRPTGRFSLKNRHPEVPPNSHATRENPSDGNPAFLVPISEKSLP